MGLTRAGRIEIARRAGVAAGLVSASVLWLGYGNWQIALVLFVIALGLYRLLPWPSAPEGAFRMERMPAIHMPDLFATILSTPCLALPFIITAPGHEAMAPWGPILLLWPVAVPGLWVYWIAARNACFWVRTGQGAMDVGSMYGTDSVRFSEITQAQPRQRRLPRWVSALLALFGGPRGAGAAILHGDRTSHSLLLVRPTGRDIVLPEDGFPGIKTIRKKLKETGIPVKRVSPRVRTHRKRKDPRKCT